MDDQILVTLARQTLRERYGQSQDYLEDKMHIPMSAVINGQAALLPKQRQALRFLFTDYEWMLAEKLAVLAASDPEAADVAARYRTAKTVIARAWLRTKTIETTYVEEPRPNGMVAMHLQLRQDYGAHGLVDILDFVVPTTIAKQLQTKKLDLLTWADTTLDHD